ncbi:helix-turn-helix domain-containing protein [Verrucomicrobiaceae bacterium R5-34]|nr:helix-turn-helix domain-containing protein [Verrucomicrobiaceae bacterium R5-34]
MPHSKKQPTSAAPSKAARKSGDFRIIGEQTVMEVVQADAETEREWLLDKPVSPLLAQHNIVHAGVMHAQFPFEISRSNQSGTFMMACFSGEGRVLADGRWIKIKAGQACLLPPFVANALKSVKGTTWEFCWVRYVENRDSAPIVSANSPVRGDYDAEPMRHAVRGLIAECQAATSPASQHHWVQLIHDYVVRFAQPHQSDERLWKLWKAVESDLAKDWNLSAMSEKACVSEEHLRRLCKKQLGRSPVQHLTYLRMRRANELLSATDLKVDAIASTIGYTSGAHFSNAFTKWVGIRPSEYRSDRQEKPKS